MSSAVFVCLECRVTRRLAQTASVLSVTHRCQFCQGKMLYVFHKFEVPVKTKLAEWKEFAIKIKCYNRNLGDQYVEACRKKIGLLEGKLKLEKEGNVNMRSKILDEISKYRDQLGYWYDYSR